MNIDVKPDMTVLHADWGVAYAPEGDDIDTKDVYAGLAARDLPVGFVALEQPVRRRRRRVNTRKIVNRRATTT